MLVSSDFLGYLNRKKEAEKGNRPLVEAALKSSPGGKEKSPPVERVAENRGEARGNEEVEYLNEKTSTVNVVL
ncbi:MAG: hypothetical protein LBJ61_07875 [Deltaproteobacteria bacterium]|jgi:hypothetical protein|nr:hypothetical protein [Deltaproteobacteria bacterium]